MPSRALLRCLESALSTGHRELLQGLLAEAEMRRFASAGARSRVVLGPRFAWVPMGFLRTSPPWPKQDGAGGVGGPVFCWGPIWFFGTPEQNGCGVPRGPTPKADGSLRPVQLDWKVFVKGKWSTAKKGLRLLCSSTLGGDPHKFRQHPADAPTVGSK